MNRHQVWSQGGVESGKLLEEIIEPVPPEEQKRQAVIERLRALRKTGVTRSNVVQAVTDILEGLGI